MIRNLAVFDDGSGPSLYGLGMFPHPSGSGVSYLARWSGTSWIPLPVSLTGPSPGLGSAVVFDDGTGPALYFTGRFTSVEGVPASDVVRWDGSAWSAVGGGLWIDPFAPGTLIVFDDGTGPGLHAYGLLQDDIYRWDGSSWNPLGTGVLLAGLAQPGVIASMAVFDDGGGTALYACGSFVQIGGVNVSNIAKWNGTTWSALGLGISPGGTTLHVHDDGSGPALYVGGRLGSAGGTGVNNIARWDGASWSSLGTGVQGFAGAMATFDDGSGPRLYVGGRFAVAGGVTARNLASWNGTGWSAGDGGVGMDCQSPIPLRDCGFVGTMLPFDDGTGLALYLLGIFDEAGQPTVRVVNIARLHCPGTLLLSAIPAPYNQGAAIVVSSGLTPGREYYNVFSLDVCPVAGSGPYLGLCASTPPAFQLLVSQVMAPLGTPITHFLATAPSMDWGPFPLQPVTIEGVSFDITGGVLSAVSPVTRLTMP